ncbi:MAG TPA: undecaprenyl-diphosphate phosphatase [Baekduia sp.]|uniref:undecaprenyl-diphosphate phosphatase n=1 Tax=Baekduia sp. TaxID=2600305 RepID=UPI002C5B0D29|nr:undecaprenyl-diphosphate phosphatase [Baekduia sp.]HMJ33102.1 undecaprenyl-diphosphate phosphatase [Baekduia sp.]
MPPEPPRLPLAHAVALGALHGPAELVPVSSSAHVALIPQLMDWPSARLPADVRKAFEVALHTGTLAGLLVLVDRPAACFAAITTGPPAAVGFLLEDTIERRLGGVRATAAGLIAGSVLLLVADAVGGERRGAADATATDALALGLAQTLALWPGLSRLGVTVAAARLRGFDRGSAFTLGREAGLPIVAGATGLKAWRLARRGLAPDLRAPFAAGAAAALAATLAAAPLRSSTSVRPAALERVVLAAAALSHLRRSRA